MITGLIQPKKWRKWIAIGAAIAAASVGTTCVLLRTVPNLSSQVDAAALAAAGSILPNGVASTLFPSGEGAPTSALPEEVQAAVSSAAEEIASSQIVSSEAEEQPAKVSAKPKKTWKGTPYPIQELVIQNSGVQYENIFVKNENDYTGIDIAEVLSQTPDLAIRKDGTPQVLLYHTHTSEAFLEEESDTFYSDMPTRTEDNTCNVVAVGKAVAAKLEAAGIGVIHDTTVHDTNYNGSYSRSAETILNNLEQYPSIQVTIDIHRDAMTAEDGTRYKPTVEINGKKAAQVMIISGCDDDGTYGFPDWEYNLRLATRLQQACADINGNFARPLLFKPCIYNENLTHNSLLVEFGTEVNTVEEALYAGDLFGDALVTVLEQFVN